MTNVVTWNVDADGFWDEATNWSGGVVPADGDAVVIDRPAGNFVITVRTRPPTCRRCPPPSKSS